MSVPRSDADAVLEAVRSVVHDLRSHAVQEVGPDSDLRADLGLDSLAMVEVLDRVAERTGVTLSEDVLVSGTSVRDLGLAVQSARGARKGHGTTEAPAAPGTGRRSAEVGSDALRRPASSGEPARGSPPVDAFTTLHQALEWHASVHPDQVNVRLLRSDDDRAPEELTYGQLLAEARAVADGLVEGGVAPGERVALMLGTERAYFSVFLGIGLAGGVPVPLYPPARREALAEQLSQLAGVLRDAGAVTLVTVPEAVRASRLVLLQVPSLRAVRTPAELVGPAGAPAATGPALSAETTALIQYTSGSTGNPKGVVLTHSQVLANVHAMARGAATTADDVLVSWLPLYHDMGLLGMWLAPLVLGVPLVLMSPLSFLGRPARWLEAISTARGTITAAPNFAFKFCVERIKDEELAGIDLSSWRLAFNGSEPVSATAVDAFVDRFSPYGFDRRAMCPAYGLAEAGVGIAFSPLGRGPRFDTISRRALGRQGRAVPASGGDPDATTLVGCGSPLPGYELRVADDSGQGIPERHEGKVLCRGPSLTAGYFGEDPATSSLWRRGWLDTGDLGYLAEGELFLTGRVKDLIIRGGRNVHPEDVEAAVRDVEGVEEGGVVAFGAPDPAHATEHVVIVAESRAAPEERAALEDEIRRKAARVLGAVPDVIEIVPPGSIRRTPSRKVRRGETRDAYLSGSLQRATRPMALELAAFVGAGARPAIGRAGAIASKWGFGARAWASVVVVGVTVSALVHLPMARSLRWPLTRWGVRAVLVMTGISVRVEGRFPTTGSPAVVVSNHPSFVDAGALVYASSEPLAFVTSTDFARKPVVGSFLRRIGCVFVERGDSGRASEALAKLVEVARAGSRLAVFPEGSISASPGVRRLHLGAFAAAAEAQCPIVPVGLVGTRAVLPPGSYLPRRGDVTVIVGNVVDPPRPDFAAEVEVAQRVRTALAGMATRPPVGPPNETMAPRPPSWTPGQNVGDASPRG
jgi:1-acyl-sn-glycerol-3-phosphate acyltransferase